VGGVGGLVGRNHRRARHLQQQLKASILTGEAGPGGRVMWRGLEGCWGGGGCKWMGLHWVGRTGR
jgi:hypothetical protein